MNCTYCYDGGCSNPNGCGAALTSTEIQELVCRYGDCRASGDTYNCTVYRHRIVAALNDLEARAALSLPVEAPSAHPMRDGYAGSTFISNASGHSLRIEYKTREQGDAAQAWLAGDAAPQEQPTDADRFCDTHCTWRDHHKDCHLAGGDKESVREQAVAWLWVNPDGSKEVTFIKPEDDPDFATVLALELGRPVVPLYASPLPAVQTVRMTEEQIEELWGPINTPVKLTNARSPWLWDMLIKFARAVEAEVLGQAGGGRG